MVLAAAVFIALAGVFFIVKRDEVMAVQRSTLGGRMPAGCAVAEGIAILLFGAFLAVAYYAGWY